MVTSHLVQEALTRLFGIKKKKKSLSYGFIWFPFFRKISSWRLKILFNLLFPYLCLVGAASLLLLLLLLWWHCDLRELGIRFRQGLVSLLITFSLPRNESRVGDWGVWLSWREAKGWSDQWVLLSVDQKHFGSSNIEESESLKVMEGKCPAQPSPAKANDQFQVSPPTKYKNPMKYCHLAKSQWLLLRDSKQLCLSFIFLHGYILCFLVPWRLN